jgi:dipeptidyl-peptidase-3
MSVDIRCKTPVKVGDLHVEKIIPTLSEAELRYATYLSLSTWAGFPLLALQCSRESLGIHNFISAFLTNYPRSALVSALNDPRSGILYLLEFAATFYDNGSNYIGYGDYKFIPRISKPDLIALVTPYPDVLSALLPITDALYSDDASVRTFGWHPNGATAYYEPRNFTQAEQEGIDALLTAHQVRKENTIIFREATRYAVKRICVDVDDVGFSVGTFNNLPVFVTKGLYADAVQKVVRWLTPVRDSALNDVERAMYSALLRHYETGDVAAHVEYSRLWVGDVDPPVEHYQGFVESYREPSGVRAEWEGIVAAVNARDSEFLHRFVAAAPSVLPLLPYPPSYERGNFSPPSYNAIDLITSAASFPFQGINIPNYDEIRLSVGFKNVTLVNFIDALGANAAEFPFLTDDILETFVPYVTQSRVLGIAVHELYGHGAGRQLTEDDVAGGRVPDLLAPGKAVETFWRPGETYQEVFGSIQGPYEECRAETTALHLGFRDEVLEMYGIPMEQRRVFRVCYLLIMMHAAIVGLPTYVPETREWKQPHSQARFVILRAIYKWGDGGLEVKKIDGKFKLTVNPEKWDSVVDAIRRLLIHLNFFKAARLVDSAKEFFGELSALDDFWIEVREAALSRSVARKCYLGALIVKDGDRYTLGKITTEVPTVLDVALTSVENIRLALE